MVKKLIFVVSAVASLLYFVSVFNLDQDLQSVSSEFSPPSNANEDSALQSIKSPASSALSKLELVLQKVENCRVANAVIEQHSKENLVQLADAIGAYLRDGNDWRALIPLFNHSALKLELLDNAYINFAQSKINISYQPDTVEEFFASINEYVPSAGNFVSFLLNEVGREQLNQRFRLVNDLDGLKIGGTNFNTITPATLMIKSAAKLEPAKFIEDIRGLEFDIFAAAEALRAGLPAHSMEQVLEQTSMIDAELVLYESFSSFPTLNLADVAIENLNIEGLKWLENRGILPSDVEGWGTPLDRAMRPVVSAREMSDEMKNKQIDMFNYLIKKGYGAHTSMDTGSDVYFSALSHGVNININQSHHPHLLPLLPSMHFISESDLAAPDLALIPPSILTLFAQDKGFHNGKNEQYKQCENVDNELQKAQLLYTHGEINELISRYTWDGESEGPLRELYSIDPVLARKALMRWANRGGIPETELHQTVITLIHEKKRQAALDYVASTSLDQYYTDFLLRLVVRDPSLVPLWNNRVAPISPSTLISLSGLKLEKIEALNAAGLDLSLRDKIGQDLYSVAMFEFDDKGVQVLLNLAPPANSGYGVDALDLLLDKMYLQDYIPEYTEQLLGFFPIFEANHLARLARLKLFEPDIYQRLLLSYSRLAVEDDTKPNPVVYSTR